jgi:hypothetical protein
MLGEVYACSSILKVASTLYTPGNFVKGINGIGKRSRYSKLLHDFGIRKLLRLLNGTLRLCIQVFLSKTPAHQFNIELLTKFLTTGRRVKGSILDRVLDFSLSPAGIALDRVPRVKLGGRRDGADGVVDTLFDLLHRDDFRIPGSVSHRMVCRMPRADMR